MKTSESTLYSVDIICYFIHMKEEELLITGSLFGNNTPADEVLAFAIEYHGLDKDDIDEFIIMRK